MADRVDRVGQRFGDYGLIRWLGGGSFGDVYLGEHVHDNTRAAVKVLQIRLTDKEDLKDFINEARTFRLRHPHIVQLLDFGIGDGDIPLLVMDYAPNGTLRQRHPRGTQLPLTTVVAYIKQVADALQYAHDRRLIHRDVKPENMLLGPNNEVLLSDFGIAVVAHSTHSLDTQSGGGTIPYMAPEQIRGKPRAASDQYALGIVVYEWLCGIRPFNGTATEIAMQHIFEPPPSLREKLPTIPPDIEQVVLIALAKDPQQRFGSVRAFAQALTLASERPNQSQSSIPPPDMPAIPQQSELPNKDERSNVVLSVPPPDKPAMPHQDELPKKDERSDVVGSRFIVDPDLSRPGVGPMSPNSPTISLSLPAGQTPIPPNYGYDKPVTIPLAQFVDSPPSQDIPAQTHTEPQSISSVSPQDDPGLKVIELPQASGEVASKLPIPAIVPVTQPDIPPVQPIKQQNKGEIAAGNIAGAVSAVPTARVGGILAWRSIGGPRRATKQRLLIALGLILLALLAMGGAIVYAWPAMFISNVVPAFTPSATIAITPASKDLKNTYTIFGVMVNPNPTLHQVQARRLTSSTPTQSKTANATGVGHTPGVQATGIITFYNGASVDQLVSAGATFTLAGGVQIVTDRAVDIPPANPPAAFSTASVSAHAASVGTSGNIAALTINQPCCSSRSIFAKNLTPFSGGQDPQTFSVVQQSDIDGVANQLKMMLRPAAQRSLQMQVQPNERFISTPQCTSNVTSDHAAGDRADNVTVTVKVICIGEGYDLQGVQTIAANLLKQQAATDPGPGYALAGSLVTGVTQVKVSDPNKGTLELFVTAEGVWVYQFSNAQKQALANLIAGKSKQAAQTLLLQQMGVAQIDVQLGGEGKTLPADTTQITIDVLTLPGLGSPTVTPTVGLIDG